MTTGPTDSTGAGDPARTVALLWRHRRPPEESRRGPRRGTSVDEIVAAATRIADRDGLEGLTMRRVAGALGVGPMTLYSYVPGRAELIDLMLDAAYLAMERPDHPDEGWRARLGATADRNRALFATHPWAAAVATGRPPLGPGQFAKYEHELRGLDDLGLDDLDRDAALAHLLDFVAGHARARAAAAGTDAGTGVDDRGWWEVAGPALAELVDEAEYPTAARVGSAVGAAHGSAADPGRAWDFGLAVVLDGLARHLDLP